MHSGNGVSKAQLSIGVTQQLKERLCLLARRQHRTLSSAVRVLLEEAMDLEESFTSADPQRSEYEAVLTVSQAARLAKRGYELLAWKPQYVQGTLL